MKNSFFHLSDIPCCENSFSVKSKCFFNEFFIPASGNGKSVFLFRALLKLLKFGAGNSCSWKLIFWIVELIFSHSSDIPSSESYFLSSGKRIFRPILQSVWWKRIFCPVETVFFYLIFVSTNGNRH